MEKVLVREECLVDCLYQSKVGASIPCTVSFSCVPLTR